MRDAAVRSKEPANTDSAVNSSCSSGSSMSYDQLIASCMARWRGSLPRRIAFRSPKRSSSRRAISVTPIVRARAAASSMARGMPSRRRQISTTTGAVFASSTNEGSAARARSTKSATAGMRGGLRIGRVVGARQSTAARPTTRARRAPPAVRGWSRAPRPSALRAGLGSRAPRPARSGARSCRARAGSRAGAASRGWRPRSSCSGGG